MAFLDVMACGLGAAILLFLIVKHHVELMAEPVAAEQPVIEVKDNPVAALRQEAAMLTARIAEARRQSRDRRIRETRAADDRTKLAELERAIREATARNETLRGEVESIEPALANDVIEDRRNGEEDYLLGMKVEGQRIAILLDRSASMTDERLLDIISRKIRSDAEKRNGPKWQRARRTARWLLHRLPKQSQVAVIVYNDQAMVLHGGRWVDGRDKATLQGIFRELDEMVPTGATNLEAGLKALADLSPDATDVYVVTDGLPTQNLSSSGLFSGCAGKGKVSGACRRELFDKGIKRSAPSADIKVHVILLPLEGDPGAAPAYWSWTAQTGGLLLTPARGWP